MLPALVSALKKWLRIHVDASADQCHVRIQGSGQLFTFFQCQPFLGDPNKPWFMNVPVGKNTLGNMVKINYSAVVRTPPFTRSNWQYERTTIEQQQAVC